jgi:hypothetical protein
LALEPVCSALGVGPSETLAYPSWNGLQLEQVYPWGTIRTATPAANHETALELSEAERQEVRAYAWPFAEMLGYADFLEAGIPAEVDPNSL